MKPDDVQREIDKMTENLKAGGDIHAGDGGYEEVSLDDIKPSPYAELFKKWEMERLIKLANEAGASKDFGSYCFTEHELKAFADALILNAITCIDPQTGTMRYSDMNAEEFWKNVCVHSIKSNFGLK